MTIGLVLTELLFLFLAVICFSIAYYFIDSRKRFHYNSSPYYEQIGLGIIVFVVGIIAIYASAMFLINTPWWLK